MANVELLPPSAFQIFSQVDEVDLVADVEVQTETGSFNQTTQTANMQYINDIAVINTFMEYVMGDSLGTSQFNDVSEEFHSVWDNLFLLKQMLESRSNKIKGLECAIQRTIPSSIENQIALKGTESRNSELLSQLSEQSETIALLEKRLECQGKVLSIQEKTLTTDGTFQNMLGAWRKKVLELLLEKEMDNMLEDRQVLALQSKIDKMQRAITTKADEIEILINKNSDIIANIKLKDKHIQMLSNELTAAKQSETKCTVLINKTHSIIAEYMKNMDSNIDNRFTVLDTIDKYRDQIERVTEQVNVLQCWYHEKEAFYADKLETLLVQHTTPVPRASNCAQTDINWESFDHEMKCLNTKIGTQDCQITSLRVEKGILSSQIAEITVSKTDMTHNITRLHNQLANVTSIYQNDAIELQKRESKTAIHAKHLVRQLKKKDEELENCESELKAVWKVEVDKLNSENETLRNDNLSLRQALRRT